MLTALDEPLKFFSSCLPSLLCLSQMCLCHKSSTTTFLFILWSIKYNWGVVTVGVKVVTTLWSQTWPQFGLFSRAIYVFTVHPDELRSWEELHETVENRTKWWIRLSFTLQLFEKHFQHKENQYLQRIFGQKNWSQTLTEQIGCIWKRQRVVTHSWSPQIRETVFTRREKI